MIQDTITKSEESNEVNTNSPIGSRHWYNTLLARTLRIGEYLSKEGKVPPDNMLKSWGKTVYLTSKHLIDNYDHIINRTDKLFDASKLDDIFRNVRKGTITSTEKEHYILSADKGDIAEIFLYEKNEWRIIVDNFPGKRKIYNTNLPIESIEDFINELKRVGLSIFI